MRRRAARSVVATSCSAAPASEVTSADARADTAASGRLRAASNRPSASSLRLQLQELLVAARPAPARLHRLDDQLQLAARLVDRQPAAQLDRRRRRAAESRPAARRAGTWRSAAWRRRRVLQGEVAVAARGARETPRSRREPCRRRSPTGRASATAAISAADAPDRAARRRRATSSGIGKRKPGAARQLHSRASVGPARRRCPCAVLQ